MFRETTGLLGALVDSEAVRLTLPEKPSELERVIVD